MIQAMMSDPDQSEAQLGRPIHSRPWQRLLGRIAIGTVATLGLAEMTLFGAVGYIIHCDNTHPVKAADSFANVNGYQATSHGVLSSTRQMDTGAFFTEFDAEARRDGGLDRAFAAAKDKADPISLRLAAAQAVIEVTSGIEDMGVKVQAVNSFVSRTIGYDQEKANSSWKVDHSTWLQTPDETLSKGKGVCGDVALLKMAMLLRVGFRPENVGILEISADKDGTSDLHVVALVRIDKRNYILNNDKNPNFDPADQLLHQLHLTPAGWYTGGMEKKDTAYPLAIVGLRGKTLLSENKTAREDTDPNGWYLSRSLAEDMDRLGRVWYVSDILQYNVQNLAAGKPLLKLQTMPKSAATPPPSRHAGS